MKFCMRCKLEGDRVGAVLDISLVTDDHFFGISEDGTEVHIPGGEPQVIQCD